MKRWMTLGILILCLGTPSWAENVVSHFPMNVTADRSIGLSESSLTALISSSVDQYQARKQGLDWNVVDVLYDKDSDLWSLDLMICTSDSCQPEIVHGFAKDLIGRLREGLNESYRLGVERLDRRRAVLSEQRDQTEARLATLRNPESSAGNIAPVLSTQLDTLVDLSGQLDSAMPIGQVFDLLSNSVEPPLNLAVLWCTLDFGQGLEINMNGLRQVRLRKALDLVCENMTADYPEHPMGYAIEDNVVVVRGRQAPQLTAQQRLAVAQQESPSRIMDRRRQLLADKEGLEIEVAHAQARKQAVEQQIALINQQVQSTLQQDAQTQQYDLLIKTLEERLGTAQKTSQQVQLQIQSGMRPATDLGEQSDIYINTLEKLVNARTALQEYKAKLAAKSGGDRLARLNDELLDLALDLPAESAKLAAIQTQLARTEAELAAAQDLRTTVQEIDLAERTFRDLEGQIAEVNKTLDSLQPPSVTCIGLK